jgi:MgtC family
VILPGWRPQGPRCGRAAILKKGGSITGLTTAATLWIATVVGLCFGGGQLGLGGISTAVGMITLWVMEWIDVRIPRATRIVVRRPAACPLAPRLKPIKAPAIIVNRRRTTMSVQVGNSGICIEQLLATKRFR